ncbi:unnamed protein product [Plutella xylostella]|uniref:(diamondback moth) hypothetical protein n=1 Tax=Plutella xylostella TaxID=51655 RepID=A0A8S4D721_PLUXY|nr:unnamed protein product [Plutella xylostella]
MYCTVCGARSKPRRHVPCREHAGMYCTVCGARSKPRRHVPCREHAGMYCTVCGARSKPRRHVPCREHAAVASAPAAEPPAPALPSSASSPELGAAPERPAAMSDCSSDTQLRHAGTGSSTPSPRAPRAAPPASSLELGAAPERPATMSDCSSDTQPELMFSELEVFADDAPAHGDENSNEENDVDDETMSGTVDERRDGGESATALCHVIISVSVTIVAAPPRTSPRIAHGVHRDGSSASDCEWCAVNEACDYTGEGRAPSHAYCPYRRARRQRHSPYRQRPDRSQQRPVPDASGDIKITFHI